MADSYFDSWGFAVPARRWSRPSAATVVPRTACLPACALWTWPTPPARSLPAAVHSWTASLRCAESRARSQGLSSLPRAALSLPTPIPLLDLSNRPYRSRSFLLRFPPFLASPLTAVLRIHCSGNLSQSSWLLALFRRSLNFQRSEQMNLKFNFCSL